VKWLPSLLTGLLIGSAIVIFARRSADGPVLVSVRKSQIRGRFRAMMRFGTGHLRIVDETRTIVVTTPPRLER
jgi:hypothetical protein